MTIALDTERFSQHRPEKRESFEKWHIDRLLCGDETDQSEWEAMGLKISVRPAVKGEILKEER